MIKPVIKSVIRPVIKSAVISVRSASSGQSGAAQTPTNLAVSLITGGIRITWMDSTGADIQIWASIDSADYAKLADVNEGVQLYDHMITAWTSINYKILAIKGTKTSAFTSVVNILWVPSILPDKQGWWRADNVVSAVGLISQATDMLGGTKHATNSTDATKPFLVQLYTDSQPAMWFKDATYHFLDFSNISLTDLTVHIVFKMNNLNKGYEQIMYGQSDTTLKGGLWTGGTTAGVDGFGGINAALNKIRECNDETKLMKVATLINGKIYINGAEATYTDADDIDSMILSRLGARVGAGQTTSYFQGFITEAIIASSQHSLENILNFHNYAKLRYNIKSPTVTEAFGDKHIDYINGNYQFGWDDTHLFYSSDGGENFTTVAFTDADLIESSVVFSNGNIFFTKLNKCYRSLDGLVHITEVVVLDKNGDPYTAQNNVGGTNATFYKKSADLNIFNVSVSGSSKEIVVWSNYANVVLAEDDCPINIYAMFDDCIPKIQYTFGVNAVYPDAGDAGNPVICRHGHNITFNPAIDEWYGTFGDFRVNNACPTLKGVFNYAANTSTWAVLANGPDVIYNKCFAGIFYLDGYVYFVTDSDNDIIFRCLWADIEDTTKHEKLATFTHYLYNIRLKSSGEGIAVGDGGKVICTQNFFRNFTTHVITGYADDVLKLSVPVGNVYKVEKYTPTVYNDNSVYITITPT